MTSNYFESLSLITGSDSSAFGTGFIICSNESNCYYVTCAHVISDIGGMKDLFVDGYKAELIAIDDDKGFDIAIIKVRKNKVSYTFQPSYAVFSEEQVKVPGFSALGKQKKLQEITGKIRSKSIIVSDLGRVPNLEIEINPNQELQKGNSGSPVLNHENKVIGIVNQRKGANIGNAIAINVIDFFAADITKAYPDFEWDENYKDDSYSLRENLKVHYYNSPINKIKKYTVLGGKTHLDSKLEIESIVPAEFIYLQASVDSSSMEETYEFENILDEILRIKRLILLGEPGSGKSTTIRRFLNYLIEPIDENHQELIPIYVELGNWTNSNHSLIEYVEFEIPHLSNKLKKLINSNNAFLLLDGLNEVPLKAKEKIINSIEDIIHLNPELNILISCRVQDYDNYFYLDKVIISNLNPPRILDFLVEHLGQKRGRKLFWSLSGGMDLESVWKKWKTLGYSFNDFWEIKEVPTNIYIVTSKNEDKIWKEATLTNHSLLKLAKNPYMLLMLAFVYTRSEKIPENKGILFKMFIETLFLREKLATRNFNNEIVLSPEASLIVENLKLLSFKMQLQSSVKSSSDSVTSIITNEVEKFISSNTLKLAQATSIIEVSNNVRFVHQILQEYFLALHLHDGIVKKTIKAKDIWKRNKWWEKTNWEEAVLLLAGLCNPKLEFILDWLGGSNPIITAQVIVTYNDVISREKNSQFQKFCAERLTDQSVELIGKSRDGLGRALGILNLDNRNGIGVNDENIPEFIWIRLSGNNEHNLSKWISKYPITVQQFQCFMDDGGYENDEWWNGLAEREYSCPKPQFDFPNYPRTNISWYGAVAYCRWLSNKTNSRIRLPSSSEWELSFGLGYKEYISKLEPTIANYWESEIGHPTAVGIFPLGDTTIGISDLVGNVWEWTLSCNKSSEEESNDKYHYSQHLPRIIKGGSFIDLETYLKMNRKKYNTPHSTNIYQGFRILLEQKI